MNNPTITADQIEDGIYFDLDEDIYHQVERMSGSGIKDLMISPAYYWSRSHLNPNPKVLTPEQKRVKELALILGNAYHCARLEPEKFPELYCREISKADFDGEEGFLSTQKEIKAALKERGLSQSGTVLENAELLDADDYNGTIWHIAERDWQETVEGRTPIAGKYFDEILVDMERIRKNPEIVNLLEGGECEVSIFWTDELGLKCKCRIDYLKPELFTEFKTFSNQNGKAIEQAMIDAVDYNRYYISIIFYWQALEAVRISEDLKVHGTVDQCNLIAAIRSNPRPQVPWFVFQEKGGIPNIFAREFLLHDVPSDVALNSAGASDKIRADVEEMRKRKTQIMSKAENEIRHFKRVFMSYSEMFDRGEEWFPHNMVGTMGDADFRPYFLEQSPS